MPLFKLVVCLPLRSIYPKSNPSQKVPLKPHFFWEVSPEAHSPQQPLLPLNTYAVEHVAQRSVGETLGLELWLLIY